MADRNLAGKVVVVTGGTGRLGQRMVRGFAGHGATVATVDRMPPPEGLPGSCHAFQADVTDEEDVARVFAEIPETCGPPDVLVHTVGTWDSAPFRDTSLEHWQRLVSLNVTSTFLCFRAAARQMHERGGRLIGIASGQGADGGTARQGAYSASKAGVIRLVEAVAREFAGTGLTAHAIAPSTILFDEDGKGVAASDLVELALYLASPAGEALNGAVLRAYG